MSTAELKKKFHRLIETINDDEMLNSYFELISQLKTQETGQLYKKLTKEQKLELNLAYNESFDSTNLLSHIEVISQHKKWL
jgi:hypothetical protein